MEVNGRPVLFQTVHGSHLYGTNHSGSDYDLYTVVDRMPKQRAKYAKQTIVDGVDSTVVDFGTWIGMCQRGVPQALEAMFSTKATYDDLSPFRAGFRVDGYAVAERYLKTMKAFIYDDTGSLKKKKHAMRLALNLNHIGIYGRFNPTLNEGHMEYLRAVEQWEDANENFYEGLKILAQARVPW